MSGLKKRIVIAVIMAACAIPLSACAIPTTGPTGPGGAVVDPVI
jgi:hypothetical protein